MTMSNSDDYRIIGLDETRPPKIRKEAYIDLFFKLSQKAPEDWCEDFNALGRQISPAPKIDKIKGECIESYVNNMDHIVAHLESLKQVVADCNLQYQEKIRAKEAALAASNLALKSGDSEQQNLNQIVEGLNFDN